MQVSLDSLLSHVQSAFEEHVGYVVINIQKLKPKIPTLSKKTYISSKMASLLQKSVFPIHLGESYVAQLLMIVVL